MLLLCANYKTGEDPFHFLLTLIFEHKCSKFQLLTWQRKCSKFVIANLTILLRLFPTFWKNKFWYFLIKLTPIILMLSLFSCIHFSATAIFWFEIFINVIFNFTLVNFKKNTTQVKIINDSDQMSLSLIVFPRDQNRGTPNSGCVCYVWCPSPNPLN